MTFGIWVVSIVWKSQLDWNPHLLSEEYMVWGIKHLLKWLGTENNRLPWTTAQTIQLLFWKKGDAITDISSGGCVLIVGNDFPAPSILSLLRKGLQIHFEMRVSS